MGSIEELRITGKMKLPKCIMQIRAENQNLVSALSNYQ